MSSNNTSKNNSSFVDEIVGFLIFVFFAVCFLYGREATVYGTASVFPKPMRSTAAATVMFVSTPVAWIENTMGWRFGGNASLDELSGCAKKSNSTLARDRCLRRYEKYLPNLMTRIMRNEASLTLSLSRSACTVSPRFDSGSSPLSKLSETEKKIFARYLPSQLVLHLYVDGTDKNIFPLANLDNNSTRLSYNLSDEGCEFVKKNTEGYSWKLYATRGIRAPESYTENLEQGFFAK